LATGHGSANPFAGVVIADPNPGPSETVTLTLSNTDAGSLSLSGLPAGTSNFTDNGNGSYILTGTPADVTSTLQSLTFLARAGRVDLNRVLVLRTASDYDQPVPGHSPAESLDQNKTSGYTGYYPALESAWRVGHAVVEKILSDWPEYRDRKW